MSIYTELVIDRANGTYSDTLEVFGLMRLMRDLLVLLGEDSPYLRLRDYSSYYVILMEPGINEDSLTILRQSPLSPIKAIATRQYNEMTMPEGMPFFDNEAISIYFDALKNKSKELPARPPHIDVIQTINPDAIQGYDGTIVSNWWIARHRQPDIFSILLKMYSSNTLERTAFDPLVAWEEINKEEGWNIKSNISGQQLFNPDQGMGQNTPKATGINTSKKSINFWIVEYLRAVGFFEVSIPRYVGHKEQRNQDKDRKILVPQPLDLTYADNQAILKEFEQTLYSEPHIQFDLLATLRYLITLLVYFNQPERRKKLRTFGNVKHKIIKGFSVSFYKKMGRARSLMNYSYIDFPGWIEIYSESDARDFIEILDELITFTRQFDEKNSDAFTLLQHLRDFISGDDIQAFFRLMTAFPTYYMGMRERGKYARQLTTITIERIISMTDKKLAPILASKGFQNIAYAIRQSTVIPQYRKAGGERLYDIRYGLGQDLTRVARKGKEMAFISALSEFIQRYNAENARIYEVRKVQYRRNVTTDDLNAITELIDAYDAPTIARMLVAYGYARVPKKDDITDDTATE